jgi:hypothetical protein
MRESVVAQLFWAKPLFCRALLDVGLQLTDLAAVRSGSTSGTAGHLYQLDEYSDLQVAQREQGTRPALEAIVERVQQVTTWLCPRTASYHTHTHSVALLYTTELCTCKDESIFDP